MESNTRSRPQRNMCGVIAWLPSLARWNLVRIGQGRFGSNGVYGLLYGLWAMGLLYEYVRDAVPTRRNISTVSESRPLVPLDGDGG